MPTECELCHEMYEKADDEPYDICPSCWQEQRQHWCGEDEPAPTPAELEAEERYYAYLDNLLATPTPEAKAEVAYLTEDYDDDGGYCGPTCGKYGDW